jgi:DNA-directed RNA polymerase specialized sigma24 family protein
MGQPCEEEYYSPGEVAQKLRVSPRTIKEHLLRARLNSFKVGPLWHI